MNLFLNELLKKDSIEIISLHKELMKNMNQFKFEQNKFEINNNNNENSKKIQNMLMNLSEDNYREIPLN
jgi:hypothetical protein